MYSNYEHKVDGLDQWDDGEPVLFRWHWPRGTFDARMSALELAEFVLPHMPSILPFLSYHPRAYAEFEAMLVVLATSPKSAIDEVVPWIKPVVRTADFDYLELCIGNKATQTRKQLITY